MKYNYILTIIALILLKNELTSKYVKILFLLAVLIYIVMALINIFLVLNYNNLTFFKNNYITKKMVSLNNHISNIKNDKLGYVFKSELEFLFMWVMLILIENYYYNFGFALEILMYILMIISSYKVLIVFTYNNKIPIIKNKFKFIDKSAKTYLMKQEKVIYTIVQVKLLIIYFLFMIMLVKI